ncbi:MAG TPA: 2OG-Fe(II) oxygenase [Myxococcota bacterium]|nr:2OG-Fe(II) oxygenase [Myxococcota bacterium]
MIRSVDGRVLSESYRKAAPFPSICIDDFLEPSFALEIARSYPQSLQGATRSYDALNEKGKTQIEERSRFPEPVGRLADHCASQGFRDVLSEISGIPNLLWDPKFIGGGMHQTRAHGRLDVHVDFNQLQPSGWFRRVNLLLFLNETWREDWGGRLELWDREVQHCVQSFAPLLNRCVIFTTSEISFHGVTALTCPDDVVRRSFALYFYTKEAPADAHGAHSTIFRARPDEHLKRYVLMPAERVKRAVRGLRSQARLLAKRALGRR